MICTNWATLKLSGFYHSIFTQKGITKVENKPDRELTDGKSKILLGEWESLTKNADGEAEIHTLRKYAYESDITEIPVIQARPVKITPSKARRPERPFTRIVAFGDTQIDYRLYDGELHPIHDERAMKCARYILRYLMPDVIVNLGDSVDQSQFGHFDKDSNHFDATLQAAFDRVHSYYAELRTDNPEAEIHEVDSNHNVRLGKYVLKHISQLYGFRPAGTDPSLYPMLTYPYMANLQAFDIKWHGGYGAAEYRYKDDLVFIHGNQVRSGGSTADLLSKKYPYANIIAGHGHKAQMHTRTTPDGKYLTAMQVGALCKTTGEVPGYGTGVDDMGHPVKAQQDWQQSVAVIDDYGDGYYDMRQVYINEGVAFFDGRYFDGNE